MDQPDPAVRRVGIMGGSFDPVHIGHLIVAQDAIERLELDEIVFVPASIPPHKQHLQQIDAGHRLNMLRLAADTDMRLSVSDIEILRGGVSYTYDTLLKLRDENPHDQWVMIVGSDTLVDLHNWYKVDEILELCEVASFLRPGESSVDEIRDKIKLPADQKDQLMGNLVEAHLIEISSTEIRMRVAEGLGIHYLVPPEVEMYIFEHGLYRV